ncbi:rho guanine nucleotide exchange factor 17 isoform X2 [Anoplophora glabripennis]|uniref:rho guanine nucleotide exchange factor 17 isoform X2 n=1 Tax=Anoplophora glabripennis TaxID=217634 RepID=UPI0008737CDF|nr:rho guanine nucleotide exchange factor 17 isoform X2 [Anoplophora glabripennis]
MSRWHEECLGRCEDCTTAATACTHRKHQHSHEDSYKRFMTIGPVRYGMRVGAVSPPPPGAGPRYRSQCCWPTTPCGDSGCDIVPISRIPLLTTPPINSLDIISCANRMRMNEDATSDQPLAEQASATVRDHVLYTGKCLLKTQLKRCALVRPQVYTRLAEYGEANGNKEDNTLDRLPRFRFGGNRAAAADKRGNDQRFRELTDRLKRGAVPVPPPRSRHSSRTTPPISPQPVLQQEDFSNRVTPLRSASFSQVDYCTDDNKYVRRRPSPSQEQDANTSPNREISTLPRSKNAQRPTTPTSDPSPSFNKPQVSITDTDDHEDVKQLIESLSEQPPEPAQINKIPEVEITSESPEKPATRCQDSLNNNQDRKRDKSRRRKGIYISQWPNPYQSTEDVIPQFVQDGDFPCADKTTKLLQDSLVEISKLQAQEENKNKEFPIWSSPQEEPLSPEENNLPPDWPRPRLLSQSPDEKDCLKVTPRGINLFRSDSLSEGEPESGERKSDQISLAPSDVSDCESRLSASTEPTSPNVPRRYSKRPLRGPYGQMLEAEMKKPESRKNLNSDLKFLEDLSSIVGTSTNNTPKPKQTRTRGSCNSSLDETSTNKENKGSGSYLHSPKQQNKRKVSADNLVVNENDKKIVVSHQRTTSSPSKLEGFTNSELSSELLEQLLRGSSEQLAAADANQQLQNDTRTHVVVELYDNERSYVESLEIIVKKYLEPLKAPDNANLLDANLVDEIFYQIPFLLSHHQAFLNELKQRLEHWDVKQKIGDVFLDMFSKSVVIESYTNYVNNWKRAREILKTAQQSKPAFSRFLEVTARQHTGKLALDSLLIKPIQKFPKYELLLQRLIKHTDENHPDHNLLLAAQRQVHEQLLKINCTEKEALELEQLREIEGLIDGLIELATPERQYLRHDSVSMSHGGGPRKERALFLFSDLLLITGIKRRSGTIRRPITGQGSVTSTLEANKYKLLMRVPLEDIEIIRSKDENLRQIMIEVDNLTEDISVLNQINELAWSLHCSHSQLDEVVKDMLTTLNKQLTEQQNSDSQLSCLDLTVLTSNGLENVSIVFSKAEKRTSWEESLNEAKQKLAMSSDRRPCPELMATVPIRKTRAGLQFTCAAPTLGENGKDVWVCNSDGYVGQVCVLSLTPEPTVTSCNGVCNARILCIASVPGVNNGASPPSKGTKARDEPEEHKTMQFDSSSSSDEDDNCDSEHTDEPQRLIDSETCSIENDESDNQQSTMWLGTEDGCIHVYNSGDNIRIKKNKIKLQLGSSILCIIYLEDRVFVSLANGDIIVYEREASGGWNIGSPTTYTVGSLSTPVSKMVPSSGKLWCGCGSTIKIFNIHTLTTETSFTVNNDNNKSITCIILCGNGVWLSLQNSAVIKCYHALTFEPLCEVNVAPAVTKMLTSCDDIIRQHKAACLRVTALVTCKDLLWIGTSAGVLLTMPLPHISSTVTKLASAPTVTGIPHGHTGHVRFLTSVEMPFGAPDASHRNSYKVKQDQRGNTKLLVISGGDGYEDFRTSNLSEGAGREDATNHLLLWNI